MLSLQAAGWNGSGSSQGPEEAVEDFCCLGGERQEILMTIEPEEAEPVGKADLIFDFTS